MLGPWTPLLFQGAEYGSTHPFLYFADHAPDLAQKIAEGRAAFVRQSPSIAGSEMRDRLADPGAEETFRRSTLDPAERARGGPTLSLHRDLLEIRRSDPVIRRQGADGIEGAVLGPEASCLRFLAPDGGDRLLLVNFGGDRDVSSAAEPLVAPPEGRRWSVLWSSEDPRYGGAGTADLDDEHGPVLAGHSALLLAPAEEASARG